MEVHFGSAADPVGTAYASLIGGMCPDCGDVGIVPRSQRDSLVRKTLGLRRRAALCPDCGCGHVFHAFGG